MLLLLAKAGLLKVNMPSKSKKQHDFMEAVAHSAKFAKKVGVPQKVGQDFSEADKVHSFNKGGNMATNPKAAAMAALLGAAARRRAPMARTAAPMPAPMPAQPAAPGMKHGGKAEMHHHHMAMAHHHLKEAMKHGGMTKHKMEEMKHGGKAKHHYAKGGAIGVAESKASGGKKEMREESSEMKKGLSSIEHGEKKRAHGEHAIQSKGHTRALMPKMAGTTTGMKHGGKAKRK